MKINAQMLEERLTFVFLFFKDNLIKDNTLACFYGFSI